MARQPHIRNNEHPYHISSRCINREWFSIPMEVVWGTFSDHLFFLHHAFQIKIHSFVLMSNHFHLIAAAPENNLSEGMQYFLRESGRSLSAHSGRINQNYGGRYFRSLLNSYQYCLHAYKYVYLNPVKAGICERAEEYPFSTLNGLLGLSKITIPLVEDTLLFGGDMESTLDWLNRVPTEENWLTVQRALKKKTFQISRLNKRIHPLEVDSF